MTYYNSLPIRTPKSQEYAEMIRQRASYRIVRRSSLSQWLESHRWTFVALCLTLAAYIVLRSA